MRFIISEGLSPAPNCPQSLSAQLSPKPSESRLRTASRPTTPGKFSLVSISKVLRRRPVHTTTPIYLRVFRFKLTRLSPLRPLLSHLHGVIVAFPFSSPARPLDHEHPVLIAIQTSVNCCFSHPPIEFCKCILSILHLLRTSPPQRGFATGSRNAQRGHSTIPHAHVPTTPRNNCSLLIISLALASLLLSRNGHFFQNPHAFVLRHLYRVLSAPEQPANDQLQKASIATTNQHA